MLWRCTLPVLLCLLAGCHAAGTGCGKSECNLYGETAKRRGQELRDSPGDLKSDVQRAEFVEPALDAPLPEPLPVPTLVAARSGWNLQELEEIALANNPTLRLAQSQIEKERGNWAQVGLYPNPVAGYLRSDPDKPTESRTNGGFVQQTFVTGGKLRLAREQESFGLQDTIQGLEAQRHRVLNDVRARFYEVLGIQHTLDAARKVEKTAEDTLNAARTAERAQQVRRLEVIRADMQLKRIRLAIREAEEQGAAAWQHLVDMAGVPNLPQSRLAGDLEEDLPDLDQEEEWQRLRRDSPLLQQLDAQVGIAHKGWQLARAQRLPDVTGQVVVERDSTNRFTSVQTLVALPIPLFNRNQGTIYNAYHELRRAETEIERTELALRDALAVSFRQYTSARSRAETLKQDVLPAAEESLDLTIRGHQRGEFPLADVLDARQVYYETLLDYFTALTELHVAAIEVQGMQLTGGLNPAEIGTAIQGAEGTTTQRRAVQQLLEQQKRGQLKKFTPGTTGE